MNDHTNPILSIRRKSFLKPAFTLIELMIVITIISMIIGLAIPALNQSKNLAINDKIGAVQNELTVAKTRWIMEHSSAAFDAIPDDDARFNVLVPYMLVHGILPATKRDFLDGMPSAATISVGNSTIFPNIANPGF